MKHTTSTTITKSSQVTLPAHAKRVLGLKPGDRLDISVEGESIIYSKPRFTLENVFGSVPAAPNEADIDLDERIRLTQEAHFGERARQFREAS